MAARAAVRWVRGDDLPLRSLDNGRSERPMIKYRIPGSVAVFRNESRGISVADRTG
jgi:hypothetical protein